MRNTDNIRVLSYSPGSGIAGHTVQQAGLRGIPGLFLAHIGREEGIEGFVPAPDTVLQVVNQN